MKASKRFQVKHNVTLRILDAVTGKRISEHQGHNEATNTMLEGIGHYLAGEGVLSQGFSMLSQYVPKYISLGTMGLMNQDEDENHLPTGISGFDPADDSEEEKYVSYMNQRPGFGADGYSDYYNNNRPYMGLGPAFTSFSISRSYQTGDIVTYKGKLYSALKNIVADPENGHYISWNVEDWEELDSKLQPVCWELVTPDIHRQDISFRDVLPEYESQEPETIDVIFSAMIPVSAFDEFRGSDKDYIFITEAGLWSEKDYVSDSVGFNGLLAGYRIVPPSTENWYMKASSVPRILAIKYCIEVEHIDNPTDAQIDAAKESIAENNRKILQEQVLRVQKDQVVQIIWKIQIGNIKYEDYTMDDEHIPTDIEELYQLLKQKVVYAENISVPASRWQSGGLPGFPYSAKITMQDVDSTYFSSVQFADEAVLLYDFCAESTTGPSSVTIYCKQKPSSTINLPIIMCTKGTPVQAN